MALSEETKNQLREYLFRSFQVAQTELQGLLSPLNGQSSDPSTAKSASDLRKYLQEIEEMLDILDGERVFVDGGQLGVWTC